MYLPTVSLFFQLLFFFFIFPQLLLIEVKQIICLSLQGSHCFSIYFKQFGQRGSIYNVELLSNRTDKAMG